MLLHSKFLRILGVLAGSLLAWALVYYLIVSDNVGAQHGFWSPARIVAYVTFFLAPAITFIPISRLFHIPVYDLEAIAGWSTLLYVVAFVDPGSQPSTTVLLLFLVPLTVSLATIFTLVSYAIGYRFLRRRSQRYDFVRARREGYLIAMFGVGCLLLKLLTVLTPVNIMLLGLIIVLLEVFLLSRQPVAAS
ncbi:MAG TPA: hypothetical protein VKU87_06505 [Thermomicrobiaceae bacterium]|nr:hypothetical protein [Thermomicrobiaceae bacterium]